MADKQNHLDELQREVLEAQLRTQKAILEREEASLEDTLELAAERRQKRTVAKRTNENRQRQFKMDRMALRRIQREICEHRAGGYAGETPITEGDGHSVLSKTIMPDGKTAFMQCPRCRLKLNGRERTLAEERKMKAAAEAVEKASPGDFMDNPVWLKWEDHVWWKELVQTHKKMGIKKSIMRGPTFSFQTEQGVPFIPELR